MRRSVRQMSDYINAALGTRVPRLTLFFGLVAFHENPSAWFAAIWGTLLWRQLLGWTMQALWLFANTRQFLVSYEPELKAFPRQTALNFWKVLKSS
jgi:hypothetical protein